MLNAIYFYWFFNDALAENNSLSSHSNESSHVKSSWFDDLFKIPNKEEKEENTGNWKVFSVTCKPTHTQKKKKHRKAIAKLFGMHANIVKITRNSLLQAAITKNV